MVWQDQLKVDQLILHLIIKKKYDKYIYLFTLLMYKVKQYNTKEVNRIDHLLFIVNRLQQARSRNITTIDLEGSCGVLTINHCVVFYF